MTQTLKTDESMLIPTKDKPVGYVRFESLRSRFKAGEEIHSEDLLQLANLTIQKNCFRMRKDQILEIFHFLLSFRVQMSNEDFDSFSRKMEKIARYLSSKILRTNEMVYNPFIGRQTTAQQLRVLINREATRVGQINAALVFV